MVKHISKIAYGSDVYYVKDVEARLNLIDKTEKGAANGIAELDSAGKVPSSQLPSYVDDVLEYSSQSDFPSTGEAGKIYIAKDTNKTYRWSGSAYTEISASLALGETSSTAYAGNKGKATTDAFNSHSSDTTIHVTSSEKTTWNGKQNAISDLSTIRSGAAAGATAYLKPSSGIPKTDLASAVQTSLGKADSALQSHQTAETIATNLTALGYKLTDTNTKVTTTVTEPTSAKTWYPISTTSVDTVTDTTVSNPGFWMRVLQGTADEDGYCRLCLGTTIATGTAGNKTGAIYLFNNKGKYFRLFGHTNTTLDRTLYLPNINGTLVAHTTDTEIGSSSEPVYVSAAGVATKCTALDATKLTGKITANNGVLVNIDANNKLTIAPKDNGTHAVRIISQVKVLPAESHILEDVEDYSQDTEVDYLSMGHYSDTHKPYISIYDSNSSKLREAISVSDGESLKVGAGWNDKVTQIFGQNVKLYSINSSNNSVEVFASTMAGNVRIGGNGDYTTYKLAVDGKVSGTSFTNTSDIRKKDVIDSIDINVNDIANAPIFKFTWLDPDMEQGVNVGTSAQYWRTVVPELITEGSDEEKTLSMQYGVAGLVSAVTIARKVVEQEKVIELQEARIKALEDAIAEIKSKLNN